METPLTYIVILFSLLSFNVFILAKDLSNEDQNPISKGNPPLFIEGEEERLSAFGGNSRESSSSCECRVDNQINSEETNTNRNKNSRTLIKLTEKNFVIIRGPIDGPNSAKIINQLLSKQYGNELYIYLITNGGSVISGMEIVQTLKSLSENKVSIKCIADTALSMGFVIFQYCPVRYVTLSSVLMQHQLSLEVSGPINQINTYMSFIRSIEDEVDKYQADRLGKTIPVFRILIAHDWWLFGENSVINKAADQMINVICDFEPKLVNETIQTMFGDIDLVFSSCPLARDPLQITFRDNSISVDEKKKIINMFDSSKYISDRLSRNIVDRF